MNKFGKALTLTNSVPKGATQGWKDFLINGGIFVASAVITYVTNNIGNLDLGTAGPLITAGVALVLKYLQKFLEGLNAPANPVIPPVNPNGPNFPVN